MNKILKFALLLTLLIAGFLTVFQTSPSLADAKIKSKHTGPFKVGYPTQQTVYAEIQSFKGDNWEYNSDIAVIVTSSKGKVLYKEEYPADEESQYYVEVKQVKLPHGVSLLLLDRYSAPTAPGTGSDIQFFNIGNQGELIPVTGVINPFNGEFVIQELKVHGKKHLFVAANDWTGCFGVMLYYPINLEDKDTQSNLQPDLKEHPVVVSEEEAKKNRKNGTIELYIVPGKLEEGTNLSKVKKESKITFIGAVYSERQWWLHIIIDDVEGYIADYHQLAIIGLPLMG